MNKKLIHQKIKEIKLKYQNSNDIDKHFDILKEIVQFRNGKVKDGERYINSSTKMIFIDQLGNEFAMRPNDVKQGFWSSYESGLRNDTEYHIQKIKQIVQLRKGKIKEGEVYINNRTKMTFIDQSGNEFKMLPSDIKRGHWSAYESGLTNDAEYHMKKIKKIVIAKGGQIKEGERYVNNSTKMIFIDKLGREFSMSPSSIKNGRWSPYESGNVYNNPEYHMKELRKIVFSKGGKIKDGEYYTKSSVKMIFIDKLGNEFKMRPNAVKKGAWSPYESGQTSDPFYHMKELKKIAESRGGKIKEGEIYTNSKTKIICIDQLGNEFKISPNEIKIGRWSPLEKNYSEHICRQIVEQIYGYNFPSTWGFVKRKNGNNLQLDGYCKELNIAFEYQGEQHFFGWRSDKEKQKESLENITKLDLEKKEICKEKNIFLLEVNYYKNMRNIKYLIIDTIEDVKQSYIKEKIQLPYFLLNIKPEDISVDLTKISHIVKMTNELEIIVQKKGGKIKDGEKYIHSKSKMTFIDKLGNEFEMSPNEVKRGGWSPYESGNVFNDPDYHMRELQKIAVSKSGKIKDGEQYIRASQEMTFIDKLGNEFKRKPKDVKAGLWSPYECKNTTDKNIHMNELEKIALFKGGRIKEGEVYINANTEMVFIDKLGNEFKSSPTRLKNGKWSPYECKNPMDKEYHFKVLQEIAHSKGGKIKDGEQYIDSKTKLIFINKKGEEFKMAPNNVKNGKWPKKHTF